MNRLQVHAAAFRRLEARRPTRNGNQIPFTGRSDDAEEGAASSHRQSTLAVTAEPNTQLKGVVAVD
jgi:hypothetical protein